MLIKLIKSFLVLIVLLLLAVVISIKYPTPILHLINTYTDYTISLETTTHNISKRQFALINASLQHRENVYSFGTIAVDFASLSQPHISVDTATITITNIEDFVTRTSKPTHILASVDIEQLTVYYKDIQLTGALAYQEGMIQSTIEEFEYHAHYLDYIPHSKSKVYLEHHLTQTTLRDIALSYNTKHDELTLKGTAFDIQMIPGQGWQEITASQVAFSLSPENMLLDIVSGKMGNLDVSGGQVHINWGERNSARVIVASDAVFDNITTFLARSPLEPKLRNVLDVLDISGGADTLSTFEFFFNKDTPDSVDIVSTLSSNTLVIKDTLLLTNTSGTLHVTQDSVTFTGTTYIQDTAIDVALSYDDMLDISLYSLGHHMTIGHSMQGVWEASINTTTQNVNQSITGDVIVDVNTEIPQVYVRNMHIMSKDAELVHNTFDIADIPLMQIVLEDTMVNTYQLPMMSFTTARDDEVFSLKDIYISGVSDKAQTTFEIDTAFTNSSSTIDVHLTSTNISDILQVFNIPSTLTSSEVEIRTTLGCECPFWQLSSDMLSGDMSLSLNEGSINQEVSDFAKLLALLSIKSISKRLDVKSTLVSADELAYTTISSRASLLGGNVRLQSFNLDSDNVIMYLFGSTNIDTLTHNLRAEVTPVIKDAAPVATLLTGGGLIGLGVWLIDKAVFDEKLLNEITGTLVKFEYTISGPWDNPRVE